MTLATGNITLSGDLTISGDTGVEYLPQSHWTSTPLKNY